MIFTEKEFEVLNAVSDITLTDYNIKWFDKDSKKGFIDCYNLFSMIEDLLCEIDMLSEKLSDLESDIEDNYRPIPVFEQCGISNRDFI